MAKIKSYFFISLDGAVESPGKWHSRTSDDEMGAAVGAGFAGADASLMGRVLYDEWAAYWPEHGDQPFGDVLTNLEDRRAQPQVRRCEGLAAGSGRHQAAP